MFKIPYREPPTAPSRVREWAARQKEEDRNAPPLTICSHSIICSIATFCDPSAYIRPETSPVICASNKMVRAHSGDATLFELGCFVYSMIDFWCLETDQCRIRHEQLPKYIEDFVTVFQEVGGIRNARELFDQRIDLYGSLVRDGKVESTVTFLESLISLTENNEMPQIFEGERPPIEIGDFFERVPLKILIKHFNGNMIPAVIRNCVRIDEMLGNSSSGQ